MNKPVVRVVFNQKGGVGKTTLAVNLATCAALRGKRVLLIDTDPQANSTSYLLGPEAEPSHTLAHFYESCLGIHLFRQNLSDYITVKTGVMGLHLVASEKSLEELRTKLENKYKIFKLRDGLKSSSYDEIWVDPPPANDFFSLSALIAAQEVLVPVDCDAFSLEAARNVFSTVAEIREDHNPSLELRGAVVNQFQRNTKHSLQIVRELEGIGIPVLKPFISSSVKVRESHSRSIPLVSCDPHHTVAQQYLELYDALEKPNPRSRRTMAEREQAR